MTMMQNSAVRSIGWKVRRRAARAKCPSRDSVLIWRSINALVDLPDRGGGERGDADRHQRRDQPGADLAAIEPDDGIDAPDLEQRNETDQGDDRRHHPCAAAADSGWRATPGPGNRCRRSGEIRKPRSIRLSTTMVTRRVIRSTATVPTKYCSSSE